MSHKYSEEETREEEIFEAVAFTESQRPFLYSINGMAPWWVVSVLLHVLIIVLAGLISMTMIFPSSDDAVVMITELQPRPEMSAPIDAPKIDSKRALGAKIDVPPTDPLSENPDVIIVSPEILARAEWGDHWETINLDRPDTQSALGDLESHIFYSVSGCAEPAGGGGMGGKSLDDLIGACGAASPGKGGGWGGGDGSGIGADTGPGRGGFGRRNGSGRKLMIKKHGGSVTGENAVDTALYWLACHQETDGHWDSIKYGGKKVDTANTAFALLAFLGAGHTEKVGIYKNHVKRAIAWLKSKQAPNGLIFDAADEGSNRGIGYPCAIATMAMAEAAGMANVPDTRAAAQKAINYCCDIHQEGAGSDKGAWRYEAKSPGDISVTGWFVMALKSAKIAGLQVNPASFEGALNFLATVEIKNAEVGAYGPASRYCYKPSGMPNARRGAIGNLIRQFLGENKEKLQSSVELFIKDGGAPTWGANGETVDLYYWYYGTYCAFQQGGDLWKRWNNGMLKALVDNQCKQQGDDNRGSWNPVGDWSGEWGRVGQTALSALCLEVYYRYLSF